MSNETHNVNNLLKIEILQLKSEILELKLMIKNIFTNNIKLIKNEISNNNIQLQQLINRNFNTILKDMNNIKSNGNINETQNIKNIISDNTIKNEIQINDKTLINNKNYNSDIYHNNIINNIKWIEKDKKKFYINYAIFNKSFENDNLYKTCIKIIINDILYLINEQKIPKIEFIYYKVYCKQSFINFERFIYETYNIKINIFNIIVNILIQKHIIIKNEKNSVQYLYLDTSISFTNMAFLNLCAYLGININILKDNYKFLYK